jgi:2-C-methyl-D-erythritol 2,4-cyclodiphosphate synthase
MTPRVGQGYDSHVFGADRPLKLAGVVVPGAPGLKGHSDGDALAHAVTDALLGAAALGDIGRHFPDTDPRWRGADSMDLLAQVRDKVRAAGYAIGNVDATVVLERPRLAPHIPAMRERLATTLGIPLDAVSVKAKTNEGMDAVGRGDGVLVMAVVLLMASRSPVLPLSFIP